MDGEQSMFAARPLESVMGWSIYIYTVGQDVVMSISVSDGVFVPGTRRYSCIYHTTVEHVVRNALVKSRRYLVTSTLPATKRIIVDVKKGANIRRQDESSLGAWQKWRVLGDTTRVAKA